MFLWLVSGVTPQTYQTSSQAFQRSTATNFDQKASKTSKNYNATKVDQRVIPKYLLYMSFYHSPLLSINRYSLAW